MKKIDILNTLLITSLIIVLFYANNWEYLYFDGFVPLYWYISVVIYLIVPMLILQLIFRNQCKKIFHIFMSLMFLLPLLWIYLVNGITDLINYYTEYQSDDPVSLAKKINLVIMLFFVILSVFKSRVLYAISCIFTYSLFVVSTFILLFNLVDFNNDEDSVPIKIPFIQTVNVYHLLFDAYSSNYAIKKYEGFDNTRIYDYLDSKGFKTYPNARSNYFKTHISMTGLFEMEYQNLDDLNSNTYRLNNHRKKLVKGCNRVFKTFNKNDYLIYNKDIFPANICGSSGKDYKESAGDIIFFSEFINTKSPKRFMQKYFPKFFTDDKVSLTFTYDSLNSILNDKYVGNKRYVYIHNPNTVLTKSCFDFPEYIIRSKEYKCFVAVVNKDIKKSIELISQKDKNALIIISGDHGSAWRHNDAGKHEQNDLFNRRDENFSIMMAVKYPPQCQKFNSISVQNMHPVNIYKYVFACLQGKSVSAVKPLPFKAFIKNDLVFPNTKNHLVFDWQYFVDNFSVK